MPVVVCVVVVVVVAAYLDVSVGRFFVTGVQVDIVVGTVCVVIFIIHGVVSRVAPCLHRDAMRVDYILQESWDVCPLESVCCLRQCCTEMFRGLDMFLANL